MLSLRHIAVTIVLSQASLAWSKPLVVRSSVAATLRDQALQTTRGQSIPFISMTMEAGIRPVSLTSAPSPHFLVQGGLHGNEALTSEFVLWLADRVEAGESLLNRLPQGTTIDFLPFANPDTFGKSRYNASGVNLNRNFGILWGISREPNGHTAFSEPETRAIRALLASRAYTAAIDVHGFVNWVVLPSTGKLLKNAEPAKTKLLDQWRSAAYRHLPALGTYEVKSAGTLGDGGAFEDWAFWGNDTLALCLEMQSSRRMIQSRGKVQDSFLAYEAFIFGMFSESLALRHQTAPETKSSSTVTATAH